MDEGADRRRTASDATDPDAMNSDAALRDADAPGHRAPSDEQIHEARLHEEAERIAVPGEDIGEVIASILGPEHPHVDEHAEPPHAAPWPPPLGRPEEHQEGAAGDRSGRDSE